MDHPFLHELTSFLYQYSWVYRYRWIGDFGDTIHPWLYCVPKSWATALLAASFDDLQNFVRGSTSASYAWPTDLLQFAQSCRCYTQRLSRECAFPATGTSLVLNRQANCVDFVGMDAYDGSAKGVNPKKWHEISRMSAFAEALATDSVTISRSSVASDFGADYGEATFQTCPLLARTAQPSSKGSCTSAWNVVDIGSGLGHLPNALVQRFASRFKSVFMPQVICVECDSTLHSKAETRIDVVMSSVRRVLFRLDRFNACDLIAEIEHQLHTHTGNRFAPFLVSGLHCCGDLGLAVLSLYQADSNAKALLLVGCCYHRANPELFPLSESFRKLNVGVNGNFLPKEFNTVATFRLACQWSPSEWLKWTKQKAEMHRLAFLARMMQRWTSSTAVKTPSASLRNSASLDSLCVASQEWLPFSVVLPLLIREPQSLEIPLTELAYLWDLTPGLLALQQLMQPLLEMFLLADRLFFVRENDPQSVSGYVRLFEPESSPRCMALVVCR